MTTRLSAANVDCCLAKNCSG